jgi:hypothetical protein
MKNLAAGIQCAAKMSWFHASAGLTRQPTAPHGSGDGGNRDRTVETIGHDAPLGPPANRRRATRSKAA